MRLRLRGTCDNWGTVVACPEDKTLNSYAWKCLRLGGTYDNWAAAACLEDDKRLLP